MVTPIYGKPQPKFLDLPEKGLKAFVGNYYSAELDATAFISMEKKTLVLRLGRHESILKPISALSFLSTYENDDAYVLGIRKIDFTRHRNDKGNGFVMSAEDIHDLKFIRMD